MSEPAEVEIHDNPDEDRYEVRAGGELAGFAVYRPGDGIWAYTHTEIGERFEGRGLASQLIRYALEDMRARGLSVLPRCPFVRGYIERHPDPYLELVPPGERARFGLPA